MARAAAARAEDLADLGDQDRARKAAEQALTAAREVGDREAEVRALSVLGRLSGSIQVVTEASELARELGDESITMATDLLLAEQYLAKGDPEAALALGDTLLARLAESDDEPLDRLSNARIEARVQHLRCRALRPLGRMQELDQAARQARLLLSQLPANLLVPLRFAVNMDVAQGHAVAGRFSAAFEIHAQASQQARRLNNVRGECLAIRWMAHDLRGLGHDRDAVTHLERAYKLARQLKDAALAQDLAREGLALLHALGEPLDSPRLQTFREALLGSE